jgi:hypothetical protein
VDTSPRTGRHHRPGRFCSRSVGVAGGVVAPGFVCLFTPISGVELLHVDAALVQWFWKSSYWKASSMPMAAVAAGSWEK